MPTYGYRCGRCGHEFEIFQRMSDDPLVECPECGGRLSKMLYPVGVQFKGSGFYTTDYKNGSSPSKSSSSSESSSSTSSESKSDSGKSDSKQTATEAKSTSPATAEKSTKSTKGD